MAAKASKATKRGEAQMWRLNLCAPCECRANLTRLAGWIASQTGERVSLSRAFELLLTPGNGVAEQMQVIVNNYGQDDPCESVPLTLRVPRRCRDVHQRLAGVLAENTGQQIDHSRAFQLLTMPKGVINELISILNGLDH